jgi:hypothetical protein
MSRYSGNIIRALPPAASAVAASGNWELEDAAQYIGNGSWPAAVGANDPNFSRNVLLLNGDGTNGAQNNTFIDSSINNFTITRNGNATQGTFGPFNGANYSNYFNGTSDYLTCGTTIAPTGNFTFEAWVYALSYGASGSQAIIFGNPFSTNNFQLYLEQSTSQLKWQMYTQGSNAGVAFALNQWNHVAVCKNGTTVLTFVNGNLVDTATGITNGVSGTFNIGSRSGTLYFNGYISNLRFTNAALYTSGFTPSTQPLNPVSSTVLLTCASSRFEDLSPVNSTITATSTPSVRTFTPFNGYSRTPNSYSGNFNGSNAFLSAPSATLALGSSDWTVECWINPASVSLAQNIIADWRTTDPTGQIPVLYLINAQPIWRTNGATKIGSSINVSANTWAHIAVVHSGSTTTMYVNGVSAGSFTDTQAYTAGQFQIGKAWDANYFNGSISNFRIVKGTAVYTANFTPPTSPLTAITNTVLLTCQSTTFVDNSSSALAITVSGGARPIQGNPFGYNIALTTGYLAALNGGSGYFDGTGDFLTFTGGTATTLNADFTVQAWIYAGSYAAAQPILCIGDDFASPGVLFYVASDGKLGVFSVSRLITGSTVLSPNAWNHVAFVRSGTTITAYLNGVSQGTATSSTTFSGTTTSVGREFYNGATGGQTNGYLAGVHLVKGTALYTGPFVPPAAPLTAVTNTQLLLNMTNGGIVDSAMANDLETVGSAQISTTIKKYGTGSASFDGTTSYLKAASQPQLGFGTGDFTVEYWVYCTSFSNGPTIVDFRGLGSTGNVGFADNYTTGGFPGVFKEGTGQLLTSTRAVSANTWTHVAFVRSGTTLTVYVNGTSGGSVTDSTSWAVPNGPAVIGANKGPASFYAGYIDDLRVTRGLARYTANFTPPGQLQTY